MNFKSTVYEYLVVQGTTRAQYKGYGTINGSGNRPRGRQHRDSYEVADAKLQGRPGSRAVRIPCKCLINCGGQGRNRTADASLFRAALYQLSYLAGNLGEFS